MLSVRAAATTCAAAATQEHMHTQYTARIQHKTRVPECDAATTRTHHHSRCERDVCRRYLPHTYLHATCHTRTYTLPATHVPARYLART